jgi:uncharacterized protein YkwD
MAGSVSRKVVVLLAVAGIAALAMPAALAAPGKHRASLSPLEHGVLTEINALRASHHLAALRLSPSLTEAARAHSQEMEADGYFEHNSFDGTAFWKRIQRFYPAASFGFWSVGENLLWSSPDVDAHGALTMWLNSPEHRKNMLDPHWREIGVSAVHEAAAPGVYNGLDVTIVTTDFGVRR